MITHSWLSFFSKEWCHNLVTYLQNTMTQSGLDSRFYFQCLQKNMTSNWPQYHTVRKSEIMSKNSIFRKIQNSEFEFFELKRNDFWEYLNVRFTWILWIFAPKIVILCKYRINNNWKCWILTIFGVKIRILT